MTYFRDVYKKRGSLWGATSKDQLLNISKRYFEDYLMNGAESETITIDGIEYFCAIRDNQQDENRISKYFLTALEVDIPIGKLILWGNEYWLVVQKEKRSFEAYNKVLAFRCNYTLNWINSLGVLKSTPAFMFSTMENKVQNNFKVASGLIIFPKANKYLEIIIPYFPIEAEQRFIIKNEAWKVVDRDLLSVDKVLYLYLVEDLLDSFEDNTTLSIADYGKLNVGYIDIGISSMNLAIGESFTFNPTLYKDNKVVAGATFTYSSQGSGYYLTINSNTITGLALGSTTFVVSSVEDPQLTATCTVNVLSSSDPKSVLQLVGDENIKWGRTRTYTAFHSTGTSTVEVQATFSLIGNESGLVSFVSQESTSCSLIANTNGLSGQITLRATTAYGVVNKEISVVSVW